MKTFQEFLTEAKKNRFKDALADYKTQQQNRAKSEKILSVDTPPGTPLRRSQLKAGLLSRGQQGGGAVTKDQKIQSNLAQAAASAIKKGKSPEKIKSKIERATHQSSTAPYKPSANYNPANVPKSGSVTAHDGSTQKVDWK